MALRWDPISRAEALSQVEPNLREKLKTARKWYRGEIQDPEDFLSLIWHEIDASRILTPRDKPRSLRDVAQRMICAGVTFDDLSSPGKKEFVVKSFRSRIGDHICSNYNPNWFTKCSIIYDSFDIRKFSPIVLRKANPGERSQTPKGILYIKDGTHRCLVYAYKILKFECEFEPVWFLLFE